MSTKNWLITGASSGFGLAMTEQLLARGDRVAATVLDVEALDALKAKYADQLWVARLELTEPESIVRVVDAAFAALGTIDVVVSNAGYVLLGAAEELGDDQICHQIETNLLGSIRLIRAALPHLRAQKRGHIVQMSSKSGQMTFPALSLYQATKWGIEGFCESLRQEVASFNIAVTIVEPGRAKTDVDAHVVMQKTLIPDYQASSVGNYRYLLAMGKFPSLGDPAKVAKAIVDAVDAPTRPGRLVLGSDAYKYVHKALTARLEEVHAQKDSAGQTDF